MLLQHIGNELRAEERVFPLNGYIKDHTEEAQEIIFILVLMILHMTNLQTHALVSLFTNRTAVKFAFGSARYGSNEISEYLFFHETAAEGV